MTDRDVGHPGCDRAGAFDRLLESACCPPPGDALLAIAAEFRPRRRRRARASASTSFARALFAVAAERDPGAAARALAALLTDEVRLRTRRVLARGAVARPGARAPRRPSARARRDRGGDRPPRRARRSASARRLGLVRRHRRARAAMADRPRDSIPAPTPSGPVRCHCGHEVAFAALTGVYARLVRDGDEAAAHHAVQLRGRLPVARHES